MFDFDGFPKIQFPSHWCLLHLTFLPWVCELRFSIQKPKLIDIRIAKSNSLPVSVKFFVYSRDPKNIVVKIVGSRYPSDYIIFGQRVIKDMVSMLESKQNNFSGSKTARFV